MASTTTAGAATTERTSLFVVWTGQHVTALVDGSGLGSAGLAGALGLSVATVGYWQEHRADHSVGEQHRYGLESVYQQLCPAQKLRVGRALYLALQPPEVGSGEEDTAPLVWTAGRRTSNETHPAKEQYGFRSTT
ncbi:hypothetical protein Kisp01_69700 [Kineosporia sp. NBRC 101677]|nr:hypothetical protein Kisp01_69700 [Kineosporia sp. NBRC 101677]